MKRPKDSNTPLIAVAMMLVAVSALLFFTEPVEYPPDESELRAFLVGEWMAVSSPEMTGGELQGFTLTKAGQLVPQEGSRVNYTYDPNTKVVSVDGSEAFGTLQCTEQFDCLTLVSTDRRVYVQTQHYEQARAAYLRSLSDNDVSYLSFLGTWVPLAEQETATPLYRGKKLALGRDLRAVFDGVEGSIPFFHPSSSNKYIDLYPEGNRNDGIRYLSTTYLGFKTLKGNGITYVRESDLAAASTAHARLMAVTGEWVCWNKGAADDFSSSKVNVFGQQFSISADMLYTGENGKKSSFAFMPNTRKLVMQNLHASVLEYTEEYGFPMLTLGNTSPFAFVRKEDLEEAHQIYLQKAQAYILWREGQYRNCSRWLKMNQTEIDLTAPLTDAGKWSASVKKAIIREDANCYIMQVSMAVTNLSTHTQRMDKAMQETYFSMSTDQIPGTEPENLFEMLRFMPDSVLAANGNAPNKVQVAPGETVTLEWICAQGKLDAYVATITDPALQDYFAHFIFGGTKYVIQLQEAFLTK